VDTNELKNSDKLISAEELLKTLFGDHNRPSLRWLRDKQSKRVIPYVKIGRLIRFKVDDVKRALDKLTIHERYE
jgi:hypothetical protein